VKICVVGAGYVGLVTSACLSTLGHRVTCVDSDSGKIDILRSGKMPIYEPGLLERVAASRRRKHLSFTTHLTVAVRQSAAVFICVGTPAMADGEVELSHVGTVARLIGDILEDGYKVIVVKSTVPVGCGRWIHALIEEGIRRRQRGDSDASRLAALRECERQSPAELADSNMDGAESTQSPALFDVVSNPEFLREGCAIHDALHPDRIVVGSDSSRARALMRALYAPIIEQRFVPTERRRPVPLVETDLTSAEMIKHAANAFLATKVSFINEIANICERVGVCVGELACAIGLDERIGPHFLSAGVGWGGSCLGKDLAALTRLATDSGCEALILKAVREVNARQRERVVEKLQESLKGLKGKTVGLLGLAFKPNTDDVRDAPAIAIAQRLLRLGVRVRGYDPVAGPNAAALTPDLDVAADAETLADGADALVLLTEWPLFRELDYAGLRSRMRNPALIDARNFLDGRRLRELGFQYQRIGG
jgi:UDPglucose 6-dehydrogenase